jgi:diguanylate cyclase (GGDEF)-like protein/PAS domain S-box-containing protein
VVSLQAIRRGYALLAAVLIAGYYLLSGLRPWVVGAVGTLSVLAIAIGVAKFAPQRWGAWYLIGLAVALLTVGDVIFTLLAAQSSTPPPYPGAPDVFYVAAYPALAVGVLWLGQPELPSRDWPMIMDTAALSLAGSLLVWLNIVRPAVARENLTLGFGLGIAVGTWVGYVALLAASARVLLAWRTNAALALVATGVFAYLVADFFYAREVVAGSWTTGSLIDLGYLAFSALCGGAALSRSMALVTSVTHTRHQLRPLRLTVVAVALLVAPTILLVETSSGQIGIVAAIAGVSGAVGLLVLGRLNLTIRAYQQRGSREQAVRRASRALVVATSEDAVVAGMENAVHDMLRPGSHCDVRLEDGVQVGIDADGPRLVGVLPGRLSVVVGELTLPVTAQVAKNEPASFAEPDIKPLPARALVLTAPLGELVELDASLRTVADQAGSALERIELTDQVHFEERERYFRTLVLTSEDVTLISKDGRVVYATPSASSMFGYDLTGKTLDELVLPQPPEVDPRAAPPPETPELAEGRLGYVNRSDRVVETRWRSRDLTGDPTVSGIVTTLRDVTAERRMERDLAFRASHDLLTGLANAETFRHELYTYRDRRRGDPARAGTAALFIDLDSFKTVNDAHGHQAGDQLLAVTGQRITSCLRHDDLAARLGGDEFAALLRGVSNAEAAEAIAQCIVDSAARPVQLGSVDVTCTVSVGLAYTDQDDDLDELVRQADTALYSAKAAGKGVWRRYREDMPRLRHVPEGTRP